MIDLPLIDEDTRVFGNEVAIKRGVFWGAEKKDQCVIYLFILYLRVTIHIALYFMATWHEQLCALLEKKKKRNRSYQWGIVKGRKDEWRKVSKMKASTNGKFCLSERRGMRSRPTLSSVNNEKFMKDWTMKNPDDNYYYFCVPKIHSSIFLLLRDATIFMESRITKLTNFLMKPFLQLRVRHQVSHWPRQSCGDRIKS